MSFEILAGEGYGHQEGMYIVDESTVVGVELLLREQVNWMLTTYDNVYTTHSPYQRMKANWNMFSLLTQAWQS